VILVAGGTGTLGTRIVDLLLDAGRQVRVLTRDRTRARHLGAAVEVVVGDVSESSAVAEAASGATAVISAIHGFAGPGHVSPARVDRDGNRSLIRATREAGAEHLVLVSVKDAAPDHPLDLMRMKFAAEQELRGSGLAWTILRPSAYMETWCQVLGRPLLDKGQTMVFGSGRNPINWVSAADVASLAVRCVTDPAMRGRVIDVGGPENLTMDEFIEVFRDETKSSGQVRRVPLLAMRAGALLARLASPSLARQMRAGIVMATTVQAFDGSAARREFPSLPFATLAEVVRRDFAGSGSVSPDRSGRSGHKAP
jgi:uncharacterized protein YbjT (DUF2867 family)